MRRTGLEWRVAEGSGNRSIASCESQTTHECGPGERSLEPLQTYRSGFLSTPYHKVSRLREAQTSRRLNSLQYQKWPIFTAPWLTGDSHLATGS